MIMAPWPKAPDQHLSVSTGQTQTTTRSRSVGSRSDQSDDSTEVCDSAENKAYRKRASKPKVRTGCISCKKRHVKCDERKPSCARCDALGVLCEGYAPPRTAATRQPVRGERPLLPRLKPAPLMAAQHPSAVPVQPASPRVPLLVSPRVGFDLCDDDGWYFAMFRDKVVPEMNSRYRLSIWTRLLFRDSATMRSIRHSILSIGAYSRALVDLRNEYPGFRSVDRPWWPASIVNRHQQAALSHHIKALSYLRQDITNGVGCPTTMAATLLFIAFENMRGNYHAAGNLVRSGLKVLYNLGLAGVKNIRWKVVNDIYEPADELSEMAHIFARHSISSVMIPFPHCKSAYHMLLNQLDDWDDEIIEEYTAPATKPSSICHCNRMLDELYPSLGNFYTKALWHKLNSNYYIDEDDLAREQALYLRKLADFGEGVAALSGTEQSPQGRYTLNVLSVYHLVFTIFVTCCIDKTEIMYDDFTPQFEEATRKMRESERYASSEIPIEFNNEVGLLPLLSFVAAKCRVQRVRLEVLDIIRNYGCREGPWDSISLSMAMERLMKLEGQEPCGITATAPIPPPESRFVWTNMFWDFENRRMSMEYTRILPNEFGEFDKVTYTVNG